MKVALLDPLYEIALDGLPLIGTPAQAAGRFLRRPGSLQVRAEAMASRHIALCASTGFVCGLGGFMTLPLTLPANVAGVALLQLHLCASTAFLATLDPRDQAVKERCVACLTGTVVELGRDVPQEMLDRSAVKLAERGLRLLAEAAVSLAGSAGRWGASRYLSRKLPRRSLPLVGGLIGGVSDLYATQQVAATARTVFLPVADVPATVAQLVQSANGES